MKIAVVGAGIGGLATGLALNAAGHDVHIYEAVPDLRALGVGINLLPHAAKVLADLGALDPLLAQGIQTRELSYYNRHGQRIWAEPRGVHAGFDFPQISIARGALQMTLLGFVRDRLGPDAVSSGHRLVSFRNSDAQAVATLDTESGDRIEVAADLLVCADGIHSIARRQIYPDEGAPVYSGRILWRATSYAKPFKGGSTMIMAGHEAQKFVCYPIAPVRSDGLQLINWIAELRRPFSREREDWNRKCGPDAFLGEFQDWVFDWLDVPSIIRSAEQVYEYPMVDRDPVATWTDGRVTLLGDAAHAMYPIGSNGASQAILDASALAHALSETSDAVEALRRYEEDRLAATSNIVRANRANGPEQCMQIAEERAPDGFSNLDDIFRPGELQEIADRYKVLTGMRRAS